MDAKPILDRWLDGDDYQALGQAVVNAYHGCDQVMASNLVFSEFVVGREHRSYLLGIFVQYAINNISETRPDFFQELKPNSARNCWHVRLNKNGLLLTAHFMGKKDFRKMARPAMNRALLAGRNGDLFASEASTLDICDEKGFAYCHLLHGGKYEPELSMLAIPSYDQTTIGASCPLPLPAPETAKSEEIADSVIMRLRKQANEIDNLTVG